MKNTTKAFAVVTAVALSLGSISAFAADTDETVKRGNRPAFSMNLEAKAGEFKPMGKGFGKMNGQIPEKTELTEEEKAQMLEDMKAKLAEKLEEGKITQEQYDEKIAAIESGDFKPMGRGFDKMNGQPSEKPELTEEEKVQMLEDMKAKLAEKLEEGKITQEQYDERIAAIESGDFKPMNNAPKSGRKAFKGENPALPNAEDTEDAE